MIKKIFVLLCSFLFITSCAFAETFYIKNYDVNISVDNTKKAHITETIDLYFKYRSHGIIRKIPAPNAEIKNVTVSEKNKVSNELDECSIKIGDANKYLKGDHRYKISYDYKFFDNKNEFYFNIIGTDWGTNIDHVTFRIEMPQPVDPQKTGLSIGVYGAKGFSGGATYTVKDNIIYGEVTKPLDKYNGVTIRIEVPDGYFIRNIASKENISICLILLSTLFCFIIWFIYGKDEKPIPGVNFYPPEETDVLDVELIYNEYATTKGIVGMIVDLAQRGYLTITNNNDGFVLEKVKTYNEDNESEKNLIDAIFTNVKQTATEQRLKKSKDFYKAVEKIIETKNNNKNNLYEADEVNKFARKIMYYSIGFLGLILSVICANFNLLYIFQGLIAVSVSILGQWFIWLCVEDTKSKNIAFFGSNILIVLPFYIGLLAAFNVAPYLYKLCFLGYLYLSVSVFCCFHMKKRSRHTLMLLGELEGLKKFIKTAEINKLQMLVDENPQYFYSILPYAYIFNLSNKWIKKFENIVKPDFAWSEGTGFKEKDFNHFIKTMNNISSGSSFYSSQSGSSGGGISYHSSSGGGGHSGGGGGGGGGSSW